jgi:RNA polymerase sigma-70 factor (ECF subfamily)
VYPGGGSGRTKKDVTATHTLSLEHAAAAGEARAPEVDSEEALIARCLLGDSESFRPLVQRHQRVVFSVALRMLGARADAEDASQQAFVDAFGALDRFRSDGRKNAFSTWIIRIAINRCKDVLKSKKRTEESLDAEVAGSDAMFAHETRDPESSLAQDRQRRALERALAKVPLKYREVLVLKDVEELSYEEIREILDLPITTLKIRVVRARAMMREQLGQESR